MKTLVEKMQTMEKIINTPLDQLNATIEMAEKKGQQAAESVEAFAKDTFPLVSVSVKEDSTMAAYIKEAIGLFVLPTYQYEFGAYTARFKKHTLFYAIRDNIYGFYSLCNAEVKADCISLSWQEYQSPFYNKEEVSAILIKEFKNGRHDLKKTPELLEIVRIAKAIDAWSRK